MRRRPEDLSIGSLFGCGQLEEEMADGRSDAKTLSGARYLFNKFCCV